MEDCVILRDLLDRGTPLHQLPAAWTKHRLADAHALAFLDKSAKQFGIPGYTLLRAQWVAHMQVWLSVLLQGVTFLYRSAQSFSMPGYRLLGAQYAAHVQEYVRWAINEECLCITCSDYVEQ